MMLDKKKEQLLKLLVALAWADGRVAEEEMEVVESMLDTFECNDEVKTTIRNWAETPRSLDDVEVAELTEDDANLALYQAVFLTYIDGEQSEEEVALLNQFVSKLGIDHERADAILKIATTRAQELLPVLNA
jgi:uncharacterized membrane protein YebE (DUF533 family)